MQRKLIALIVALTLTSVMAFATGGTEQSTPETTTSTMTAEMGYDTLRYSVAEWEAESGKTLTYKEAPSLASNSALPPVAERVGKEPMVVLPVESIGTYGGTWRRATLGVLGASLYFREALVIQSYDSTEMVPNIAQDWEMSADAKEFTFYLREGMKWSDGEPFTADDFVFRWNDINFNAELNPAGGGNIYAPGGEPGTITKLNDYAFKYTFSVPQPLFLEWLGQKTLQLWAPKHYLEPFHADYADKAKLDAMVKDEGFASWTELFKAKHDEINGPTNVEAPTIAPWIMIDTIGGAVQRHVRNPYYWKVDTAGNQLPYMDQVDEYLMGDTEAILLKALAGDVDYQTLRISSLANYPTLKENEEKGGYHLRPMMSPATNFGAMFINYFHSDPVMRELLENKDFRIALSIAIDRNEINDIIFKGLALPSQAAPPASFPFHNEELATQYTDFDTDKANQMLDEIGLKWDNDHKWRVKSDGDKLQIVNLAFIPWPNENVQIQELVKQYWAEIGVDMVIKPTERALWVEKVAGSDFDVASYGINKGFVGNPPAVYTPVVPIGATSHWAQKWVLWYNTDGADGEEPPADVKRLRDINVEYQQEPAAEKRAALNAEALEIHARNFWTIGMVNEPQAGRFFVIKNDIGNSEIQGYNAFRTIVIRFPTNMALFYHK
jgi:peptide/nickel transport system substrate-binding protein